jgi:CHAT domain-containing protein
VRLPLIFVGIGLATGLEAQQSPVQRLHVLAAGGDTPALLEAVREHPDDAREVVRRLLVEAGRWRAPRSDSALALARRLASAYTATWEDSFPHAQVTRFSRMSSDQRAAKVMADSVRRAGNDALGRVGVDAALSLWRQALRRSTAIADTAGMAAALGNIGAGLYRASELDSAEVYVHRARALAETIGDRRTALNALNLLGSVAKDRGELRRAQLLYTSALDLRARIGDMRGAAADHNNLGLLSAALGERGDARAHYEEALAVARRYGLDEPAAAALLNLGNAASLEGEYREAARRYHDALAIYRSSRSDADAALVLHNLGLLALRRGDYAAAQARLRQALLIFTRAGTTADIVLVRRDLASVAAAAGDLRSAMGQLRLAERFVTRGLPDPELMGGLALARADLAAQLNSYGEAERQYVRAEASYRQAKNASGRAEAQQGRALLSVERRQYGRALELLRGAARVQAAAGDRRPSALTQVMIGHTQHRQGDLASARRTLEQATDSLRVLGDAVGEAATLGVLGDVEMEAGAPLAAEAFYRRGLARLKTRPAPTVSWQLRAGLGYALHARGALAEAAAELRAAVDDIERVAGTLTLEERRATFLADKWDVYTQLAIVERARGDVAAAFTVSERMRARQMLALLARGRVAPSVADTSIVNREQDLRRRIGELTQRLQSEDDVASALRGPGGVSNPDSSSAITREALARAQEHYAQILLELREQQTGYTEMLRVEVPSWRDVASRLAPGEALLEYLVSDSTTVVFVVTPDTLRVVELDVDRRALESLVDFARGTLVRPRASTSGAASSRSAWRTPLRRLYQHLFAPVEATGMLDGVGRLIVVPHVELHYLPFAALVRRRASARGQRDEFLVERYEIAYAPSASVWVRLGERRASSAERVLAVAPSTRTLPGSREEANAIQALYGDAATVLTNGAASETAFRAAAPQYGVVHLATYGVLNKHNPLFSYVSLNPGTGEDGRLEVHEVFGLELNARLLVLSACQTALASGAVSDVPAGDDWVGLVRAFLGIGVANVIATLWPVEDRSTARLMVALHRDLRAGHAEAAALAEAQRRILRNPPTADPFYWAGFVLVGGR